AVRGKGRLVCGRNQELWTMIANQRHCPKVSSRVPKNEILSVGRYRIRSSCLGLFELFGRAVAIGALPEKRAARGIGLKDDALTIPGPQVVVRVIKAQTPHGGSA